MRQVKAVRGMGLLAALLILGGSGFGAVPRQHARAAASDTLIFGVTEEPDTLNPIATSLTTAEDLDSAVFDTLLTEDAQAQLHPQLATSVDHTPDGLTWTFHLRHGVKWADGVPFTSADVAYTYQALMDKKHTIASTIGWDQIVSYSTPDAYTFTCRIRKTNAPFLVYIAAYSTSSAIIPKHIYDKPGFDFNKASFNRTPMGTGPYMVSEWKTADHITLVPNPYSWRGQPHFKKIIYKIVPNDNTLLVQLRTGDVDMGVIRQDQVQEVKGISGKRLITTPSNTWEHIDLKQYGFLREKAVRQALDYATPKEAILKGILKGVGQVAYADVSPAFKDYYNSSVPQHPFSLATAAKLLAADGFTKGSDGILRKNGQPFAMQLWSISSDSIGQRIEEVLKAQWATLGISVDLRSQGTNTIFGPNGPQFQKTMTGIIYSWTNNPPDPDDSYYWNSSQIPATPTGAGGNLVGYYYKFDFQKQIDDLTNAGVTTVDTAKRRQVYLKIQALLADEMPVIFLNWVPNLYLVPTTMSGFTGNPFNSLFWNVADWRRS